jgi:beta-glucosidase
MFAFGHGLSYNTFEYRDLTVSGGDTITAGFTVVNTSERAGADVPQLYLAAGPAGQRFPLLGFERVVLGPGESCIVTAEADPRVLARYDGSAGSCAFKRALTRWQ